MSKDNGKNKPTPGQRRRDSQSYPHGGGSDDSCAGLMLLAVFGGTLALFARSRVRRSR